MSRGFTNWVFTVNNPHPSMLPPQDWPDYKYLVYQLEEGDGGTRHWQGYVSFVGQKRMSWIKSNCSALAHFERRKGSHKQAKKYCMKSASRIEGPWEHGEDPCQGKRSDLIALKEAVDKGDTLLQMCEDHWSAMSRSYRFVSFYRNLKNQCGRDWPTLTSVYWGVPGIGKSWRAKHEHPHAYWLPKPTGSSGSLWFDGYDGHDVMVIDEFYGWIQRSVMCRLCDRYPLHVQTKGGTVPFLARVIVITSNVSPHEWWPKVGLGPMERRLSGEMGSIEEITQPWRPPTSEVVEEVVVSNGDRQSMVCEESLPRVELCSGQACGGGCVNPRASCMGSDSYYAQMADWQLETLD